MLNVDIKRGYSCFAGKRIQGDQNCRRVSEELQIIATNIDAGRCITDFLEIDSRKK